MRQVGAFGIDIEASVSPKQLMLCVSEKQDRDQIMEMCELDGKQWGLISKRSQELRNQECLSVDCMSIRFESTRKLLDVPNSALNKGDGQARFIMEILNEKLYSFLKIIQV